MSFKWNENSTLMFLNAYQKHPCLWNPHHAKFYDCSAKNEALKNIIKELDIPELNIFDCLEQIKVIREKYGQEQVRIIEGFRLQKPYKSSLVWFPIISEMLTKVINDESKLQNRMRSAGTISPSILKDCVTTPHDKYKDISNFPCAQETRQDYKAKSKKNSKFTTARKSDILEDKKEGKNNTQLLQCPSCGWEDIKPDKLDITTKQNCEQIKSLDIVIPCPEYINLLNKPYEGHKTHRHRIADITCQKPNNNTVQCPSFSHNLPNYMSYPTNTLKTHTYCSQNTRNHINQQTIRETIVTSKPKFCARETQLSRQLFSEKRTKQVGTNIGHCDKEIQNTICVSKINVTVPSFKSSSVEANIVRKCHREVQNKPLLLQENLKQVAVNTMERCDKEIQNTICVNLGQNFEKYSSQQSKQVDTDIVECPANDMQNLIGIKLKSIDYTMPNIILVTTDGNYLPLIQTDFKLKQLTSDKCHKDTENLCHDQKEAEKACFALHGKKLIENDICTKEICSPDTMEIIKHNSVMAQSLLQCLGKLAPLQEKTKTHSVTSILSKKDDVNSGSSKTTICEPCKFANEGTHFATSSAIELENSNCLPCLEQTEKDNVTTISTKILELIKHALVLNSKKCAENMQKGCVRKEDAIDTLIFLNKIKECADKILRIYMITDCSKKQLSNKYCSRYKSKDKCPPKVDLTLNENQTQISENGTNHFTASYKNSKDIEVLYGHSTSEIRDPNLSANNVIFVETETGKESPAKNKEITSHSEYHDIGLNVSLSQVSLRDMETQYSPRQLQDTGVVTEHEQSSEERVNISTQNREPILIRVIKCNNSEGILKLDKETCVRDAHVAWARNVDKCIETYPMLFPRFSKNVYRKYLVEKYYNKLLHSDVSHIREKKLNYINYRTSLLSDKNYRYDKKCKSSLLCNQNWIKANIPSFGLSSNQRVSRIPLYTGSHKYTRKTNLYKMSQLYM